MRDPKRTSPSFSSSRFFAASAVLVLEYYVDVEEGVGIWEWELGVIGVGSRDGS